MHYVIVATYHDLQKTDSIDDGLAQKLATIIGMGRVVLIAEEVDANTNVDTFGRRLSRTIGQNRWLSIDMTDVQRRDAGILAQIAGRRLPGYRNGEFFPATRYYRGADGIRENFWLDRIEDKCQELQVVEGTILITCGYIHGPFLREKAAGRGHVVTLEEYLPYDRESVNGELLVCD
jgi:hypothetical protein